MQVVAAVFTCADKCADKALICRKRAGLPNGGLWEFPGGKRNPDESLEMALLREIKEEMQVAINHLHLGSLGHYVHNDGARVIELHCFVVSEWQGEFSLTDHDQIRWCSIEELRLVELSAADVPFVDRIESYFNSCE